MLSLGLPLVALALGFTAAPAAAHDPALPLLPAHELAAAPAVDVAAAPAESVVGEPAAAPVERVAADRFLADREPEETAYAISGPLGEYGSPAAAAPAPIERTITVRSGNTLVELLTGAGLEQPQAHILLTALRTVFNPRDLRPGHEIALRFAPGAGSGAGEGEPGPLLALSFDPDIERTVTVERAADGSYAAREDKREFERRTQRIEGAIQGSLYEAAIAAGLSPAQLLQMVRALSYDVDFQRDIQPGDRFEVMAEHFFDQGRLVRQGHVLYARLTLSGKVHELYRHQFGNGEVDWFNGRGESLRKALLRTPMDGARISSRFGMRRHPVLGFSRMHRGVDFAAPTGTPIYASGDGVVAFAGWRGGYGKAVVIRHNGEFSTLYGHMSRIARISAGQRVRQGQVIGYVGSTGMSTGPHLHYEVHRGGSAVNPGRIQLAAGRKLAGQEMAAFQTGKRALEAQFAALPAQRAVAPETAQAPTARAGTPAEDASDAATAIVAAAEVVAAAATPPAATGIVAAAEVVAAATGTGMPAATTR